MDCFSILGPLTRTAVTFAFVKATPPTAHPFGPLASPSHHIELACVTSFSLPTVGAILIAVGVSFV